MKRINDFIIEKLKVSSHKTIPYIDVFIKEFGKYIGKIERAFSFKNLESCKDYNASEPETFINILPTYKFNGNEEFLHLPGNRYFVVPKDTIYIVNIDLFKDNQEHYFTLYFLQEEGINKDNFQVRRNFDIFKDDLIEIIGEDKYLEIYDYIRNHN